MELPKILEKSQKKIEKIRQKDFLVTSMIGKEEGLNEIALGDNGVFMKNLIESRNMNGKINMVYIDPPFFSKAKYDAVIKVDSDTPSIKHLAYEDLWEKGLAEYLNMMASRLYLIKELLADDGTVWVHLDWHVVHYVKVLMDEIFGEKNFVNEIVWTYKSGGSGKKHFSRKHDTILVYSKTKNYYFNPGQEKSYNRDYKPYRFKGVKEYKDDIGWYTMVNMKDVWAIDMVGRTSAERTGYATQKPEALLERIIEASTKEGDICADFFCGSGTLAAVANRLGRTFICCDQGRLAVTNSTKRLAQNKASFKVTEMDGYKGERSYGNAKFSFSFTAIDMTDKYHLIIDFDKYIPKKLEDKIEEKSIKDLEDIIKCDSLKLIECWSVDFDYDGEVHRPSVFFSKGKNSVEARCEKIFSEPKNIHIEVIDVFGNLIEKIISKDDLI